jgi:glutathione peroxidase
MNVHDFTAHTIDGKTVKLSEYTGHPLLIVNVASKCGLTPQYEGLEKLNEDFGARGLRVIGFPANEFGAQEPGTNDEIKTFCTSSYGVKFDMMSKVVVKGDGIDPLFDYLTTKSKFAGDIKWNFNKFLVDKNGEVVARFEPQVEPTSAEVRQAIEKAL